MTEEAPGFIRHASVSNQNEYIRSCSVLGETRHGHVSQKNKEKFKRHL